MIVKNLSITAVKLKGQFELIKKITDMTPQDKKMFLEATKQSMKREHGIEWADIERKIQDEINVTIMIYGFLWCI